MTQTQRMIIFIALLFFAACTGKKNDHKTEESPEIPNLTFNYKKYQVKSGLIIFETVMKTKTVDLTYKSIVYFDHFGMVERKDTYSKGQLEQTILSNGKDNYNISHIGKTVVRTGHAYRGTESKFAWDDLDREDLRSGKVVKLPAITIAGKKCKAYSVKTGFATATFAGWKNILLLNQIESAGGKSTTMAKVVRVVPINPVIFHLPEGYKVRS